MKFTIRRFKQNLFKITILASLVFSLILLAIYKIGITQNFQQYQSLDTDNLKGQNTLNCSLQKEDGDQSKDIAVLSGNQDSEDINCLFVGCSGFF